MTPNSRTTTAEINSRPAKHEHVGTLCPPGALLGHMISVAGDATRHQLSVMGAAAPGPPPVHLSNRSGRSARSIGPGNLLPIVKTITSSRTPRNSRSISTPGRSRFFSNAAVNGLLRAGPSMDAKPAPVENAMNVLAGCTAAAAAGVALLAAGFRASDVLASDLAISAANGFCRPASTRTMPSLDARSICGNTSLRLIALPCRHRRSCSVELRPAPANSHRRAARRDLQNKTARSPSPSPHCRIRSAHAECLRGAHRSASSL